MRITKGTGIKSGLVLRRPSGEAFELSYSDLAEMADELPIPPELLMDVLDAMKAVNLDNQPLAQTRKHLIEALHRNRYITSNGEVINDFPDNVLQVLSIVLLVRIEASAELSWKPWMKEIWLKRLSQAPIREALGAYLSTAPLVYSSYLRGLIFEEVPARETLAPLDEDFST